MKLSRHLLIAASLMLLCSCIHIFFEKPSVTLKSLSATPSLKGIEIRFGLEVNNPNRYDLSLESLSFNLIVDEESSGSGLIESPVLLPARTTVNVEIPVMADMKLLGKCLSVIVRGKELQYRVEGDALVKAALGEKNFHFSRQGVFTRDMLKV